VFDVRLLFADVEVVVRLVRFRFVISKLLNNGDGDGDRDVGIFWLSNVARPWKLSVEGDVKYSCHAVSNIGWNTWDCQISLPCAIPICNVSPHGCMSPHGKDFQPCRAEMYGTTTCPRHFDPWPKPKEGYTRRLIPMVRIPLDEIDDHFDEDAFNKKSYPNVEIVDMHNVPKGWVLVNGIPSLIH
jgi:hypothetical protein